MANSLIWLGAVEIRMAPLPPPPRSQGRISDLNFLKHRKDFSTESGAIIILREEIGSEYKLIVAEIE
jgi:hypothetical protein